jgi:hypothetical protein
VMKAAARTNMARRAGACRTKRTPVRMAPIMRSAGSVLRLFGRFQ